MLVFLFFLFVNLLPFKYNYKRNIFIFEFFLKNEIIFSPHNIHVYVFVHCCVCITTYTKGIIHDKVSVIFSNKNKGIFIWNWQLYRASNVNVFRVIIYYVYFLPHLHHIIVLIKVIANWKCFYQSRFKI